MFRNIGKLILIIIAFPKFLMIFNIIKLFKRNEETLIIYKFFESYFSFGVSHRYLIRILI